ncbi:hypothetical protein SANTM175S_00288 [Streptomyces antimycoticus]
MSALTATRAGAGKQVDGGKGEAKSKDEQKREEVTAKLQMVFDATQKDVEGILDGLDGKVDKQFEEGEKKARDAFNTDQKRRMKAYKDKRYTAASGAPGQMGQRARSRACRRRPTSSSRSPASSTYV